MKQYKKDGEMKRKSILEDPNHPYRKRNHTNMKFEKIMNTNTNSANKSNEFQQMKYILSPH